MCFYAIVAWESLLFEHKQFYLNTNQTIIMSYTL